MAKKKSVKKINKAARIRALLAKGQSVLTIAKKLKVNPNYVYTVQWKEGKKPKGEKDLDIPAFIAAGEHPAQPGPAPLTDKPLSKILVELDYEIAYLKSIRDYLTTE